MRSHLSWSSFPLTTCSLQDPQVSPKGRSLRAQLSRFFFPTSMLVTGDSLIWNLSAPLSLRSERHPRGYRTKMPHILKQTKLFFFSLLKPPNRKGQCKNVPQHEGQRDSSVSGTETPPSSLGWGRDTSHQFGDIISWFLYIYKKKRVLAVLASWLRQLICGFSDIRSRQPCCLTRIF